MSRINTIWMGGFAALMAVALSGCSISPQAKEAKHLLQGKALLAKKDYARALLEFRNAAQAMPKDAEPHYQMGLVFLRSGDSAGAVRAFQGATQLNSKHTQAQLKLAEMLVGTRNRQLVEEAAKRLETILASTPDNSEASGSLAVAEWKLGQPEDATKRLEDILRRFPTHLQGSVALAKMKVSRHDLAGAQEVLQHAVVSAPQSPEAAVALGQLYWISKQHEKAEAEMTRALRLDPKNGSALLGLAAVQVYGRRLEEAEQTYQRLALLPDEEYRHLHALFLFRIGKQDAALAELLKLAKVDPKDRTARTRLLAAYVAMGKNLEAQRLLAGALKDNPKDTDALFQRAELYLRSGNAAAAKDDLAQVLHFKPESAQAHFALAEVYRAEGSPQSRQQLAEALQLDPGMLAARLALSRSFIGSNEPKTALQVLDETPASQKNILGVVTERNWALLAMGNVKEVRANLERGFKAGRYLELVIQDALLKMQVRDYVGARICADEVLRQNSEDIRAARLLADSYMGQKEPMKALARLGELAEGHPRSAPLHNLLGEFQLEQGKLSEARKSFETTLAIDPQSLDASFALAELDRRENHPDAARQHLTAILMVQPKNIRALLMLANTDDSAGNLTGAIAQYRAVLDIDSRNLLALNNLAYSLAVENPDEALKYAQQAGQIGPDNPAVQDTLGWVYYRKGIYSSATGYLKAAVAKEPTAKRQFHLGMAYIKAGDRELGQKTVAAALLQDPNLPRTELGW